MKVETESVHRERLAEIHAEPGSRKSLEARHGQVCSTDQVREEFEILGFMAPYVVVRRRSDGVKASLEFQYQPRFFFNFEPE